MDYQTFTITLSTIAFMSGWFLGRKKLFKSLSLDLAEQIFDDRHRDKKEISIEKHLGEYYAYLDSAHYVTKNESIRNIIKFCYEKYDSDLELRIDENSLSNDELDDIYNALKDLSEKKL